MFTGEYRHSLDPKSRLVLPSEIRAMVEEGAVVTKSMVGRYLVGFPRAGFDQLAGQLAETVAKDPQRRVVERRWFAAARPVTPDRAGRILIPQTLREHAGLETEAVIVGVNDHFEIWDAARYDAEDARADALIPELIQHAPELTY